MNTVIYEKNYRTYVLSFSYLPVIARTMEEIEF